MFANMMIPNPRFPGSPARMADGRHFTDFKANCHLTPQLVQSNTWPEYERRQMMFKGADSQMNMDRMMTVMRAGHGVCVDTMVPEMSKRVYSWNGPVELLSHPAGVGTGRMYLPGRQELVTGDPDVLAAATFPELFGTFGASRGVQAPIQKEAVKAQNRYSAPYGSM
jgi:hypothetical protein